MPGLAGAEDGAEGYWLDGSHGSHGPHGAAQGRRPGGHTRPRVEAAQGEGSVRPRRQAVVDTEQVVEGEPGQGGRGGSEGPRGAGQPRQAGRGDAADGSVAGEAAPAPAPAALRLSEVLQGGGEGRVGVPVQRVAPPSEVGAGDGGDWRSEVDMAGQGGVCGGEVGGGGGE